MTRVSQLKLLIVIASTRPGRVGLPVGEWFLQRARDHGGFEPELADLAVIDLPLLDEPNHPRLRQYTQEHTRQWSAVVDAADAIVFVTAEYNYGYPAALKNAIDYLHAEWRRKPVGFVSYGGVSGGTRAVQQLKQIVQAVQMYAVAGGVIIPWVAQMIGEDGVFRADEPMDAAASVMLDELAEVGGALAALRA
jgi:NAD(P)H-dependent FMN reductase